MTNYIKQVKELDKAIHYTRLAINSTRAILNGTTDHNIAKAASEVLLRWLEAYKHELTQLERLSNTMTDEEIDKLDKLLEVRIGTGQTRKLYTTEYRECKYLYVD